MEKQELLKNIRASLERGIITRQDLVEMSDVTEVAPESSVAKRHLDISEILYYLGGIIVFIGIAIFVGEKWDTLGPATKVLATLGVGIAAYVSGVLLSTYKNLERMAIGFHVIGALLIPGGIFVALDVAAIDITLGLSTSIFSALFAFYVVSYLVYKRNLFLFLSVLFGTISYFLFTDYLTQDTQTIFGDDFSLYRILVLGLAYMLLGYSFRAWERAPSLVGIMNSVGIISFLGASFALGGTSPDQNIFWEIIFPGLALGIIFLSTQVKSRSYLILGTIFLMGYIFKITAEYFSESIGWPLALVLVGFAFIGIGYGAVALNKKYLKSVK